MLTASTKENHAPPEQIDGYELQGKIGEGGMATVYQGVQTSLQRPVAVKFLQQNMAQLESVREYFDQESLIIARLNHPNIIHVIDRGISNQGTPYFVMEFIQGQHLGKILQQPSLPMNQKLDYAIQIGKALSYAHKHGIIHRDIKPANMLIDEEGIVHVLDFGIAQLEKQLEHQEAFIMGSMPYMAPEQRNLQGTITTQSDIYAFGVLLYELFSGQQPADPPAPLKKLNPRIPPALELLIDQCMQQQPQDRPASAAAITDNLRKLLQGAHLHNDQRQRASQGIRKLEEKFALLDVIREDDRGAVYLYENRQDQNLMVIKKRIGDERGYDEARLLTQLDHPNINKVLGTSRKGSLFIIPMEYQGAGNLQERLLDALPVREAARIGRDICAGLAFAHNHKIFHNNLQPSNILFSADGQVKITDFGLHEYDTETRKIYNFKSTPASAQADIFATGVMLYQMFTGELPQWKGSRLIHGGAFEHIPTALHILLDRMLSERCGPAKGNLEAIIAELNNFIEELDKTRITATNEPLDTTHQQTPAMTGTLGWLILFLVCGVGLSLAVMAFIR